MAIYVQDFCPSFVRSIFYLAFSDENLLFNLPFFKLPTMVKFRLQDWKEVCFSYKLFLMGSLLLLWHSLSETPGTPIPIVVLTLLTHYVGYS